MREPSIAPDWPVWAGERLQPAFFERDPREVAPDLLGMLLVSVVDNVVCGGTIVEAEAYLGSGDPGSHAATRGITARNAVMYGAPGSVYVYFTYGSHHMVNLVCLPEGEAGAVLVRALEPVVGIGMMRERRVGCLGCAQLRERDLANGPGKLASAMGLSLIDNGTRLNEGRVFAYEGPGASPGSMGISGRVGLSTGHELQLRFFVKDSPFVSKGRIGPPRRT